MEAKKTAVDYLDEGDRLLESGTLEEAIGCRFDVVGVLDSIIKLNSVSLDLSDSSLL
jgi:hypothetical protein